MSDGSDEKSSLYARIGESAVRAVITEFYRRAFVDPIIGHFFVSSDIAEITALQIDFARSMLGGPKRYRGKPLAAAHKPFVIRHPHFGRRQVLMAEVLADLHVDPELAKAWLTMEEALRPIIVNGPTPTPKDW
jgi:truncated hemoglobin YjbI